MGRNTAKYDSSGIQTFAKASRTPDEDAADRRARDAAEPAHDDDDEREQEDVGVGPGTDRQRAGRGDTGQTRERRHRRRT